jgi:hypothetical protein
MVRARAVPAPGVCVHPSVPDLRLVVEHLVALLQDRGLALRAAGVALRQRPAQHARGSTAAPCMLLWRGGRPTQRWPNLGWEVDAALSSAMLDCAQ